MILLELYFLEANNCILDLAGGKMQITDKTVSLIRDQIRKYNMQSCSNREPDYSTKERNGSYGSYQLCRRGHMATRGYNIQKATNLCCKNLDSHKKPECTNKNSQLRYKNTKIATAKLISDEAICCTS